MLLRVSPRRFGLFIAFLAPIALVWVAGAGPAQADDTAELVQRAANAQQRAAALRAKGDEARAKIADGLAQTWTLAARDVAAARKRELETEAIQLAALDAGVQAQRERALLEELVAQNGRLSAQIAAAKSGRDGGAK